MMKLHIRLSWDGDVKSFERTGAWDDEIEEAEIVYEVPRWAVETWDRKTIQVLALKECESNSDIRRRIPNPEYNLNRLLKQAKVEVMVDG